MESEKKSMLGVIAISYIVFMTGWYLSKIFTTRPHGKALLIAIPLVLFYYLICWAVAGFKFSFEMNLLDYLLTVLGVGCVGIFDIIILGGERYV